MKVRLGQCQVLRKTAIASEDSENRSVGTMASEPAAAKITGPARAVDLSNDTLPSESRARAILNNSDKLMSRYADVVHIATADFDIGGAYTGGQKPYQSFTFSRFRRCCLFDDELFPVEIDRLQTQISTSGMFR